MLESYFNKVASLRPTNVLKEAPNRCFPVNFAKILRTHSFTEHLLRLLLVVTYCTENLRTGFSLKGMLAIYGLIISDSVSF